ncbi:MAG: hypothetical protein J6K32_07890 [Clostridia bacterium]|nr:hypothetical protein [Clostridia bacterium]
MTAIFVIAVLACAGTLYAVCDNGSAMGARQMHDYYRVEFKKSYRASELQGWY